MSLLSLPIVECSGDAAALGEQQGEALRERIAAFIQQRLSAFVQYSAERGGPGVPEFLAAGARCFEIYEAWDAEGAAEQRGIARGAGVSVETLYGTTNM